MQYAVGIRGKRSIHTVGLSTNWSWGLLGLMHKGHCTPHAVDTVGAVGVSAKRSTHGVDLANMGGGDHYL